MLQKIIIGLLVTIASTAQAAHLNSYAQVADAIAKGKGIRVVLDFSQCETNAAAAIQSLGSVMPDAMMVIKDKYVTFANLHFTTHHPAHSGHAVYESNKFILKPDNTFSMKSEVLNPTTYEPLGSEFSAECQLNKGVSIYSSH
jgi:hypothetical protein